MADVIPTTSRPPWQMPASEVYDILKACVSRFLLGLTMFDVQTHLGRQVWPVQNSYHMYLYHM
jgi:hypothetical protein